MRKMQQRWRRIFNTYAVGLVSIRAKVGWNSYIFVISYTILLTLGVNNLYIVELKTRHSISTNFFNWQCMLHDSNKKGTRCKAELQFCSKIIFYHPFVFCDYKCSHFYAWNIHLLSNSQEIMNYFFSIECLLVSEPVYFVVIYSVFDSLSKFRMTYYTNHLKNKDTFYIWIQNKNSRKLIIVPYVPFGLA